MLIPAILANAAFGGVLALIFVLYYVLADGKWKLYIELLIGAGGNTGLALWLISYIPSEEVTVRLYALFSLLLAFLLFTAVFLWIAAWIIKDKEGKDVIRLRDIFLGQSSYIKKYYENRAREIDTNLSFEELKRRETAIDQREAQVTMREEQLKSKSDYISAEFEKMETLGKKKLKLTLPENSPITLTHEYLEAIPSYVSDTIVCVKDISSFTDEFIKIMLEILIRLNCWLTFSVLQR